MDGIVARWIDSFLRGHMLPEDLLGALDELSVQLPPSVGDDDRARLAVLRAQVEAVVDSTDDPREAIEVAAVQFLGEHPATAVEARGAPNWSTET